MISFGIKKNQNIFSGIEYNTKEGSLSYSTLYAFGAWCVRNFGGAKFIKEAAQCNFANEEAILYAVNLYNGSNYNFFDLMELYTKSLVNQDSD